MLNFSVCSKCARINLNRKDKKLFKYSFMHRKMALCPVTIFIPDDVVDVRDNPPRRCPYKLEHAIHEANWRQSLVK
jgi:hypothetical protein